MLAALGLTSLALFMVFLAFYLTDPRRMLNGFLFNVFFCSFLLFCGYLVSPEKIEFCRVNMVPLTICWLYRKQLSLYVVPSESSVFRKLNFSGDTI